MREEEGKKGDGEEGEEEGEEEGGKKEKIVIFNDFDLNYLTE